MLLSLLCGLLCSVVLKAEARGEPEVSARIAYTSMPPWVYMNEHNEYAGIIVEYFRSLAAQSGMNLKEEFVPQARLHYLLKEGKLDIVMGDLPAGSVSWGEDLGIVYRGDTVVFARKGGPIFQKLGDGKEMICRIGLSGYLVEGYKMFDADGIETCYRMVLKGRLSFLIGERLALTHHLHKNHPEAIDAFEEPHVVAPRILRLYISHALLKSSIGDKLREAARKTNFQTFVNLDLKARSKLKPESKGASPSTKP